MAVHVGNGDANDVRLEISVPLAVLLLSVNLILCAPSTGHTRTCSATSTQASGLVEKVISIIRILVKCAYCAMSALNTGKIPLLGDLQVKEQNSKNKVIIYSKTYCPYCARVRPLLP